MIFKRSVIKKNKVAGKCACCVQANIFFSFWNGHTFDGLNCVVPNWSYLILLWSQIFFILMRCDLWDLNYLESRRVYALVSVNPFQLSSIAADDWALCFVRYSLLMISGPSYIPSYAWLICWNAVVLNKLICCISISENVFSIIFIMIDINLLCSWFTKLVNVMTSFRCKLTFFSVFFLFLLNLFR